MRNQSIFPYLLNKTYENAGFSPQKQMLNIGLQERLVYGIEFDKYATLG